MATNNNTPSAKSIEKELENEFSKSVNAVPFGGALVAEMKNSEQGKQVHDTIADAVQLGFKNIFGIAAREGGFWAAKHIDDLAEKHLGADRQQEKAIIHMATNATIVLAEPAMIAFQAKTENEELRKKLRAELTDYAQHYDGDTLKPSPVIPAKQSDNSVLANLEKKVQAQFDLSEALIPLAIGTAQWAGHEIHKGRMEKIAESDQVKNAISEKKNKAEELTEKLTESEEKLGEFLGQKPAEVKKSLENSVKEAAKAVKEKEEEIKKAISEETKKINEEIKKASGENSKEIKEKLQEQLKTFKEEINEKLGLDEVKEAEKLIKEQQKFFKDLGVPDNSKTIKEILTDNVNKAAQEHDKLEAQVKSWSDGSRSALVDLANQPLLGKDAPQALKDLKPYDNKVLNTTAGLMAAGLVGGKYAGEMVSTDPNVKDSLVAAELIIYLDKQIKADQIVDGKINLNGLKSDHTLPKEWGSSMKLEEFVQVIFNTHAANQTGEPMPMTFQPKLAQISSKIADSLTTPNPNHGSEAILHPLSMIDLVPKIISDDCSCMANIATVHQEIDNSIKTMPLQKQMDTIGYLEKMGNNYSLPPDEMIDYTKQMMRGMHTDTLDLVAYLMPVQVLVNEMQLKENEVLDARARASEFVLDDVKQIITELNAKSDQELLQDVNKAELKTIRSAAKLLDDDSKLQAELSNRDVGGLPFAIISCKSYMQELANGKKITGVTTNNPEQITKVEAPSNDNNVEITDFIDPKSAEIAGKSINAEKSAAKVAI